MDRLNFGHQNTVLSQCLQEIGAKKNSKILTTKSQDYIEKVAIFRTIYNDDQISE